MGTGPSIKINYQGDIALDDILKGMSDLDTTELEQFMQRIGQLVAQRKSPHLSDHETELLAAISNAIPSDLQNRYEVLADKQSREVITDEEHNEMLRLIESLELKYAERLGYIIDLANIRGVSLDEIVKELNLRQLHNA